MAKVTSMNDDAIGIAEQFLEGRFSLSTAVAELANLAYPANLKKLLKANETFKKCILKEIDKMLIKSFE